MNTAEILQSAGYPTDFVVIDLETYFDKDYSLSNMNTWEYINDERYETIGCGFKYSCDDEHFVWANELSGYFSQIQLVYGKHLENITVVIQNVPFDALILQEKYNIKPKYMIDLKHLDAHFDSRRSHKLKDMAKREKLPDKGETMKFIGLHLADFEDVQRQAMEKYCARDCELEYRLFEIMLPYLSNAETELALARHTADLYLQPRLKFDFKLAAELKIGMVKHITDACELVNMEAKDISGNISFTAALQAVLPKGETVPTKYGKRPGKKMTALLGQENLIPALAKTDDGCKMLLAHSDPIVRNLMEARQAVKSWPLHIKRVDAMKRLATACVGWLPVPLNYYGGHCVPKGTEILTETGWDKIESWSGKRKIAQWSPDGSIVFDNAKPFSAYVNESLCKFDNGVANGIFTQGHTIPYFTKSGNFTTVKAGEMQQCESVPLSGSYHRDDYEPWFQTKLLVAVQADGYWQLNTRNGRMLRFGFNKPRKIERIKWLLESLGILFTVNVEKCGATRIIIRWKDIPKWLKPEYKFFGPWLLCHDPEIIFEELIHWDGWKEKNSVGFSYSTCDKINADWLQIVGHLSNRRVSISRRDRPEKNWRASYRIFISKATQPTIRKKHWSTRRYRGPVYCPQTKTGYWVARFNSEVIISGNTGRWSGGGGINLQNLGGSGRAGQGTHPLIRKMRNLLRASDNSKLLLADSAQIEARILAWLAGQQDMLEAFAEDRDIYSEFGTKLFAARLRKPRKTDPPPMYKLYEIRRGFSKDTILGAGYGLGHSTFYKNCLMNSGLRPLFDSGQYDLPFIKRLIKGYRTTYSCIPKFWKAVEKCFRIVTKHPHQVMRYAPEGSKVGPGDLLTFWNNGGTVNIQLPSGRILYYPHAVVKKKMNQYDFDNQLKYQHGPLWGGSLTENIVQAIARDLLGYWILECEKENLPVTLHIHDEIITISSDLYVTENLSLLLAIMGKGPTWADGLPLAAEGEISETYKK